MITKLETLKSVILKNCKVTRTQTVRFE